MSKEKELLEVYRKSQKEILYKVYDLFTKIENKGTWSYSDAMKYDRYTKIMKNVEDVVNGMMKEFDSSMYNNLSDLLLDTYAGEILKLESIKPQKDSYQQLKELDKSKGIKNTSYTMINKKLVEEVILHPWNGSNFSQSIWKEKNKLIDTLKSTITQSMITGESIQKASARVRDTMGSSAYNATRLIRTETMRARNEAKVKAYKENDVETLQWDASPEQSNTCDICKGRHEKQYPIDNLPIMPAHPHCRCTWIPILSDIKEEVKKDIKKEEESKSKEWGDFEYTDKEFKDKKEISSHLNKEHGIKFSDSRKYPMDKDLLSDCSNFLDKFHSYFEGFKAIDPVELGDIKVKGTLKNLIGCYKYYLDIPKALELDLNGMYFSDKKYNAEYIERCVKSKWTVPNARGHKTFVHEYGHHIVNSMRFLEGTEGKPNKGWCKGFINDVIEVYNKEYIDDVSFKDMKELVSQYGGTSYDEAFAETFAEYFGGENPRGFAKVFGKMLEEKIRKFIKQ